jgi:hypothetical protein
MACIYEAVSKMRGNTTSTTAGYIIVLVVLALQYVLLGKRMESLMEEHAGMTTLIQRLVFEAGKMKLDVPGDDRDEEAKIADISSDESLDSASLDGHSINEDVEHSDERSQPSSASDRSDEWSASELG